MVCLLRYGQCGRHDRHADMTDMTYVTSMHGTPDAIYMPGAVEISDTVGVPGVRDMGGMTGTNGIAIMIEI